MTRSEARGRARARGAGGLVGRTVPLRCDPRLDTQTEIRPIEIERSGDSKSLRRAVRGLAVFVAANLTTMPGALAGPPAIGPKAEGTPRQNEVRSNGVARRLVVAWNDLVDGSGVLRAMSTRPPWTFETPALEIGPESVLRSAGGQVYVVSRSEGTVAVVAPDAWTTLQVYPLGEGSEPQDIAVVSPDRAYVTRRTATHLLRLELDTGACTDVVDLSLFADDDGVPDMGMMAVHEGRLFVQIRRVNLDAPGGVRPATLPRRGGCRHRAAGRCRSCDARRAGDRAAGHRSEGQDASHPADAAIVPQRQR